MLPPTYVRLACHPMRCKKDMPDAPSAVADALPQQLVFTQSPYRDQCRSVVHICHRSRTRPDARKKGIVLSTTGFKVGYAYRYEE